MRAAGGEPGQPPPGGAPGGAPVCGLGVRAIARALRLARNSVRTVLTSGTAEVPGLEREQIGDAHLDALRALYADCKGNRVRVWEEAQKQGSLYPTPR